MSKYIYGKFIYLFINLKIKSQEVSKEAEKQKVTKILTRILQLNDVPKGMRILYILSFSIMGIIILSMVLGMIMLALSYISPELFR